MPSKKGKKPTKSEAEPAKLEPAPEPVPEADGEADEDEALEDAAGEADATKKKKRRPKKKKAKEGADEDAATEMPQNLDSVDEPAVLEHDSFEHDRYEAEQNELEAGEWIDITALCDLALQDMQPGEMVHAQQFRLFDAMSAIEIMDPKMDSGYNCEADMTLPRAIEQRIVKTELSHSELIAIWDWLLMYYLLWLEGHTIVQTVFCCLYLHDPENLLKPISLFSTFVDALMIACRESLNIILKAGIFDDEDFIPNLFNVNLRDFHVNSSDPKTVAETIDKEVKALRGTGNKQPETQAIISRLDFMKAYMLTLVELAEVDEKQCEARLKKAQSLLRQCTDLLKKLDQSAALGEQDARRCFDPSINRRLLVPGPPRQVTPVEDHKSVIQMWTLHLEALTECGTRAKQPLIRLLECEKTSKQEANVLPRSVALSCVCGHAQRLTLESLCHFMFPEHAMEHCKTAVDEFLEHGCCLVLHLLKLSYLNRARRFRRIAHVFNDFNTLQHEAWQLDEDLKKTFQSNMRHPRPTWVWVMEFCLTMMLTKLFLGFSLELYDIAEFHMIYWYADYLYGLRIYNMNELQHHKEQTGGSAKKKPQRKEQGPPRPKNPSAELVFLQASQAVVRGLFRLLIFCNNQGNITIPAAISKGLASRFVLRFKSLEAFRLPHSLSFQDFVQSSSLAKGSIESRGLLAAAQESFTEATQLLDKCLERLKDKSVSSIVEEHEPNTLKRVIVANQLAIRQLQQDLDRGENDPVKVKVVNSHHPYFVSIQVQPRAPPAAASAGGYPDTKTA